MNLKIPNLSVLGILAFLTLVSLSEGQTIPSIFKQLLTVSCEYSGLAPRSRRSIPEGPNLKDPKEFFKYLYPLADFKLDDFLQDEKRSSSPLSISTWIDDLIDLWKSHCNSQARVRRQTRASYPIYGNGATIEDGDVNVGDREDPHYPHGLFENPDYVWDTGDEDNGSSGTEASHSDQSTTGINSTKPVEAEAKKPTVVTDTDRFFAQYGGDIEYFFPLIQFGIPFDGEILFLGFKGFKGIWPYP